MADSGFYSEDPEENGDSDDQPSQRRRLHPHGNDKEDQGGDLESREECRKSHQQGADSAGGTHQINALGAGEGLEQPSGNNAPEVEAQVTPSPQELFKQRTGEPERDHVDDQVKQISVEESMGHELPPSPLAETLPAQRHNGKEGAVKKDPENLLDQEKREIDPEKDQRDR